MIKTTEISVGRTEIISVERNRDRIRESHGMEEEEFGNERDLHLGGL